MLASKNHSGATQKTNLIYFASTSDSNALIVNFYFWLTRATFKTKKHTTKPEKGNSDKMIYVETCTISSFISHTQKAMTMHGH